MQSPPYERRRQASAIKIAPLKASSMLDGSGTMTVQPGKSSASAVLRAARTSAVFPNTPTGLAVTALPPVLLSE